jgi:hypothetical protein
MTTGGQKNTAAVKTAREREKEKFWQQNLALDLKLVIILSN